MLGRVSRGWSIPPRSTLVKRALPAFVLSARPDAVVAGAVELYGELVAALGIDALHGVLKDVARAEILDGLLQVAGDVLALEDLGHLAAGHPSQIAHDLGGGRAVHEIWRLRPPEPASIRVCMEVFAVRHTDR